MKNLKIARIQKNLSQKQLAAIMEVNFHTISRYERGTVDPPIDRLIKMANVLETTTDYLIGR